MHQNNQNSYLSGFQRNLSKKFSKMMDRKAGVMRQDNNIIFERKFCRIQAPNDDLGNGKIAVPVLPKAKQSTLGELFSGDSE